MGEREGGGGMTWELITALVGVISGVCGIVFGARNSRRADTQQAREDVLSLARIEGKLDSANRGIEDMRVEIRTHGNQIADLGTRITRCEESCKSAHHRIDRLDETRGAE